MGSEQDEQNKSFITFTKVCFLNAASREMLTFHSNVDSVA